MSSSQIRPSRPGIGDVVLPLVFVVGGVVYALNGKASGDAVALAALAGIVAGIVAMQLPWPWLVLAWIIALVGGIGACHAFAGSLAVAWVAFLIAGGLVGTTIAKLRRAGQSARHGTE